MSIEILDPTYDDPPADFSPAPRIATLHGRTIGIISNGKHGTRPFFDALAHELRDRYGVGEVIEVLKSNYSAPAGDHVFDQARRWHALVAGVGD